MLTMAPLSSRKSGVEPLGNVPWGTHICHFFDTEDDLVDLGVAFCAAGIEQRERCVWLISDPERGAAAAAGLHGLDVELIHEWEWYGEDRLEPARAAAKLQALLDGALERGLTGLRVCGCEAWHRARDWEGFQEYEAWLDQWVKGKPLVLLCSYPLASVGAVDVLEVVRNHHIAIAKRNRSEEHTSE